MEENFDDLFVDDCFDLVHLLMSRVLDAVIETAFLNEIKRKVVPYAIQSTCLYIFNSIDVLFIRHEIAEPCDLQENEEPQPPTSEAWARSVIPVKLKFIDPAEALSPTVLTQGLNVSQSFSKKSGNIFRSSFKTTQKKTFHRVHDEEVRGFPIEEEEKPYDPHEEFVRNKKIREEKRKIEEKIRLDYIRQEEKRKRQLVIMQFRGKIPQYTHDSSGKLIIVSPIKNFASKTLETVNFQVREKNVEVSLPDERKSEVFVKNNSTVFHMPLVDKASVNIFENMQLLPGVSIKIPEVEKEKNEGFKITPQPQVEKVLRIPEVKPKLVKKPESMKKSQTERILPDSALKYKNTIKNIIKSSKELEQMVSLSPVDRFNVGIMSNATWGANPSMRQVHLPARLPKRNDLKDDWEVFGHIFHKPKDNLFATPADLLTRTDQLKKPKDRKVTRYGLKTLKPSTKIQNPYFSP
jgi:hypothetical protein